MLFFPLEIFKNILSFLDVKEHAALQEICRELNTHMKSSTICLPYLKRLKNMNEKIATTLPGEAAEEDWCYRRFVEGFKQIAQSQQKEVQELHDKYPSLPGIDEKLKTYSTPVTTLKDLEDRHEMLEEMKKATTIIPVSLRNQAISKFLILYRSQYGSLPQTPQFTLSERRFVNFTTHLPQQDESHKKLKM